MPPKIHCGKLRSVGSMSCWALGGFCLMHSAVHVYCHPVKLWKTTSLDESFLQPDCLPGPAAEGPGLGNKLVSFNIHSWWKEISRSVKMGLKGLCRWWAESEKIGGRVGGEWQREWSRDLGCSEAGTRLRKQTEQSHNKQAQNHSACQWDRERGDVCRSSFRNLEKYTPATILQSYF